jgi:hypothetical protein
MATSKRNVEPKEQIERAPVDKILEYSLDILEKKYDLYMWCETKVHTLVTLNGLLLGGIFVLVSSHKVSGVISLSLLGATLLFLLSSLFLALWHVKPLMYSGRTKLKNLRTTIGTEAYSSNEEYIAEMMNLTISKMIELDAEQIRGMNRNIMMNQRAIKWGVRLTATAIFLAAAFFVSVMVVGST